MNVFSSRVLVGMGALILTFGIVYIGLAVVAPPPELGFAADRHSTIYELYRYPLFFLATVGGVLASACVASLRAMAPDEPVEGKLFLRNLLFPKTFIAMVGSPIVFFSVVAANDAQVLNLVSLLAAFQNGFFWEQIVAGPARHPPGIE